MAVTRIELLEKTGTGNELTETFTESTTLKNIATGEKHSILFGKIKKAISSFISHSSTHATNTVSGHVTVDTALSGSSTNPVQNKVINSAFQNALVDMEITALDKLSNTGDASKVTVAATEATTLSNLTGGEKLSASFGKIMKAISTLISHVGNKSNPHAVTVAQIGATPAARITGQIVTVAVSAWVASTTDSRYPFVASVTVAKNYTANPSVGLVPASGNLTTDVEDAAWKLVKKVFIASSGTSVTLYSEEAPTTAFKMKIWG